MLKVLHGVMMKKELQAAKPKPPIGRAKSVQINSRALEWRTFLEMPETQELIVCALRQRLGLEPSIQPVEAF
jgi:hypothetical protein